MKPWISLSRRPGFLRLWCGLLVAAICAVNAANATAPTQPWTIDVTLDVERENDGTARSLHVTYVARPSMGAMSGSASFVLPAIEPFGRTIDRVTTLSVADADGALEVQRVAAPDGVEDADTVWKTRKPPRDFVRVEYSIPVALPKPARRGPQSELQAAGDGVATSGRGFLILPLGAEAFQAVVHWKLRPGQSAVSSLGESDRAIAVSRDDLLSSFYLAGTLYRFPAGKADNGFVVRGLGQPALNTDELFSWAKRWYVASLSAFQGRAADPFRVFFRSFDGASFDSGFMQVHSLLLYIPLRAAAKDLPVIEATLAHEMTHMWTAGFEQGKGESAWFDEGIAEYLSMKIAYSAGLVSISQYVDFVNRRAAVYYGNHNRSLPDQALEKTMWQGADSWTTHYMRSFMYFADLDAKLRKQSHGRTDLLVLINAMNRLSEAGKPHGVEAWRDLVHRYAGEEGLSDLDRMLAGDVVYPAPGAFATCMVGGKSTIGVFSLGYRTDDGSGGTVTVTEVTPGSNASKAGLRVGDRIVDPGSTYSVYSQWEPSLTLTVVGPGPRRSLTFSPRSGTVSAMKWSVKPAAPGDLACR